MIKVVAVKFRESSSKVYNSREYYYKTFFNVEAGDEVIVDTSTVGLNIAMVSCADVVDPSLQKKATKYLVQRIDKEEYLEKMRKEKELMDLKRLMDLRVSEIQVNHIYEVLAKEDEVLANMLMDYKQKQSEI